MDEKILCKPKIGMLGFLTTFMIAMALWVLFPANASSLVLVFLCIVVIGKVIAQAGTGYITREYIETYLNSIISFAAISILIFIAMYGFANITVYDAEYKQELMSRLEVEEEQLLSVVADKDYWDTVDSKYELVLGYVNAMNKGVTPKLREYYGNDDILRQISNLNNLEQDDLFDELTMLAAETTKLNEFSYLFYVLTNILMTMLKFSVTLVIVYCVIDVAVMCMSENANNKEAENITKKANYVNPEIVEIQPEDLKFQEIKEDEE